MGYIPKAVISGEVPDLSLIMPQVEQRLAALEAEAEETDPGDITLIFDNQLV